MNKGMRTLPIHHAVRGIAACWIALAHLVFNPIYNAGFAHYSDFGWLAVALRFDYLAVDFFFLLSGCLLTLKYRALFEAKTTGGKEIDRFYLQRLARIYPLHLATLAFLFATALAGMDWPHTAGHWAWLWEHRASTLPANLALMHAWGILPSAAWNEPAWTISIFMLLYVLFPNLIYLTRRIPERAGWHMLFLLIGGYALQRELLPTGGQSDGVGAIIRGFCFFTSGLFIARLHHAGWKAHFPWHRILYATLAVGLAMLVVWANHPFDMVFFHLLYPLFLLACLRADGRCVAWLKTRPFYWAGSRAYAIYMVHYPVMVLLGKWPASPLISLAEHGIAGKALSYMLVFALLFLIAELAFRAIERPCHRWAKNHLKAPLTGR